MRLRPQTTKRRGSVLPLVTICLVALISMIALAVDIGMIAVARNQCQNAADASAMAGARTINGDDSTSVNYNLAVAPVNAIKTANENTVFGVPISGNPSADWTQTANHPDSATYNTGQISLKIGKYLYTYNDADASKEGFSVAWNNTDTTEPYSAVQSTITFKGNFAFARIFGLNNFNTTATAIAVHRPRDVMIIMDLSGSMRFQSLPGTPMSGGQAAASSNNAVRTKSLNPDPVFPLFGHYADNATAALQGTSSIATTSGEYVDPGNQAYATAAGSPIVLDFFQNAPGVAPNPAVNLAFTAANPGYATSPGGDDYLKTTLDTSTTYAKTVAEFNNNSTTTNAKFEVNGYKSVRASFNGYTQGPNYWGKTFWIWPPAPRGSAVLSPPALLTDTSFNWYNNKSDDWRQRYFVAVNNVTQVPSWVNHNTILWDITAPYAMKTPGTLTTVTENGAPVVYTYRINYAAILYWLQQGPSPFPATLQAGRIRYYTAMPSGTDNTLNKRWWTTANASLPNDERFWKEYIDFVLGFTATGVNTYTRTQNGAPISGFIGNGDYYQWSGSTPQITQRPQPQPAPSSPGAPYQSGTLNGGKPLGATTLAVSSLGSIPTANKDYVIIGGDTANPYLIQAGSTLTSLVITPGLAAAKLTGATVQVFSPYMDYSDCPMRPRHQFWFGPMTFVDWLGNYQLSTGNGGGPHHLWPGNCHESHAWACKAGIQSAIDDIKKNHPNDFVGMTFFSSPMNSGSAVGHHNRAVVPLGRQYQQLKDSLWFPPTTVTGGVSEISPFAADMFQVPRADGGTTPGMGFMIAYNQFSSSTTKLRTYSQPSTTYRGSAGGLGRKGASRLIIFETDGVPNSRAFATFQSAGSNSYYPIRVYNPANMGDTNNVEWPNTGGSFTLTEVYDVVKQIAALDTATNPGFGTVRKPVYVNCIGYGGDFDPVNAGTQQTNALTALQTIQFYGNTSPDTTPANFPTIQRIYGTSAQRITSMQKAFSAIMQNGVQVSLIQ